MERSEGGKWDKCNSIINKICIKRKKERKIYREPTVTGRKPGLKSTIWNKRENSASIQNKMKKQEFKNMRRLLQLLGQSET